MNREDFIRIINNSDSVNRQMVGEVRELLDLFPYFQSAHLLLLKGLHNTSDVRFESQLRQSAIYVADREVLYHLLKREPVLPAEPQEQKTVSDSFEHDPSDSQQTVIESAKSSEDLINETIPVAPTHSLLINEESGEEESGNIVFLLDNEEEPSDEKAIFMDPAIYTSGRDDLLELDLQEDQPAVTEESHVSPDEADIEEKLSRKRVQAELIDKFIIANPRIEPVRDKSDVSLTDISNPFTEEKGGFITETLARIYINQGYYSKAIDIYEKLCLKFPEKSSYFATQIEKVKELIK
jgi:hypothetical protein